MKNEICLNMIEYMRQYVEDGTLPPGLEDMLKSIKLFQYFYYLLFGFWIIG